MIGSTLPIPVLPNTVLPAGRRAGYAALLPDDNLPPNVTPELRDSVLAQLASSAGGTVSRIADTISAPGDYFRGVLAGKTGERITGRQLLREYGLADNKDDWGDFFGGLAADVITDPLTYLLGPAASVSDAGKLAGKANLLNKAATAATRKAIATGAVASGDIPLVAKQALSRLGKTARTLNTADPATVGMPLYGTATARRGTTLADLITYADDPVAARKALEDAAGGASALNVELARKQPLAHSFGFATPLGDPIVTGDFLGKRFGDKYADAIDTLMGQARWSYPGRVAHQYFNKKVGNALDAEEQMLNIANFHARDAAVQNARKQYGVGLARAALAHPEAFSDPALNRVLGRFIEGPNAIQPGDLAEINSRPELKRFAENWANVLAPETLAAAQKLGIPVHELIDPHGIRYMPRMAHEALELGGTGSVGRNLSAIYGNAYSRQDALKVPGGTSTLIDLSLDPKLTGPAGTRISTDDAAAQYVLMRLRSLPSTGGPKPTLEQAQAIAGLMRKLPSEAVQKGGLFGQHPAQMIGTYMERNAGARATADLLHDSLASMAVNTPAGRVANGGHVPLVDALKKLGLDYDDLAHDIGAQATLRDRIAKVLTETGTPTSAKSVDLAKWSVPQELVDRLTRARAAFNPQATGTDLLNMLDHYTSAWKSLILAWPARATRDLFSGAMSNWLEGAADPLAANAAKALLSQGPTNPTFVSYIRQIPRYSGADGVEQFLSDVYANQLLRGTHHTDVAASTTGKQALAGMPGMDPVSVAGAVRQLGSGWNTDDLLSFPSKLRPFADLKNPVMRFGADLNTLTDGINRTTGYLSLMKQGYDPSAAAAAMKRAHADASTLSDFERNWMRLVFPWYSYTSRIFPEVLRQLIQRPGGRYGQMLRALESVQDQGRENAYVPSHLRSQFAFPIPEALGGRPSPEAQSYVTGLAYPGLSEFGLLSDPTTVSGLVGGTARNLAMQTHPILRNLLEVLTGRDFFTDRPAGEATSPLDIIAQRVTGTDIDLPQMLEKPIELLPGAQRPLYLLRTLLDDRGGVPLSARATNALINTLSGFKRRTVLNDDVLANMERQAEHTIDPYTRDYTMAFIPENSRANVPQWALDYMDVRNAVARQRRANKKARASGDVAASALYE